MLATMFKYCISKVALGASGAGVRCTWRSKGFAVAASTQVMAARHEVHFGGNRSAK